MTDNDNDRPRSSLAVWFAAVLMLLPAMYVFSIGPAIWLCSNGYLPYRIYYYAYLPILALYNHYEPFRYLLDWYAVLWGADPP